MAPHMEGAKRPACCTGREAWLERVTSLASRNSHHSDVGGQERQREKLFQGTTQPGAPRDCAQDVAWACQATELRRASTRLRGWQFEQYARDARNWGVLKVVRVLIVETFNRMQSYSTTAFPCLSAVPWWADLPILRRPTGEVGAMASQVRPPAGRASPSNPKTRSRRRSIALTTCMA